MYPVFVGLAFFCVTEIDRFSFGGSDGSVAYEFSTGTVQGYAAEKAAAAAVKQQKVDDGSVVPVTPPGEDVS